MILQARDLIAILIFIGGFYLKLLGIDGTVGILLVMITTWYFGIRASTRFKR